jgi:predicted NBD/HSP70 family sugar kinase
MPESQPADLALMRELNERIVLGLLRQAGPISRAELARRSNLSRSTVSSIITALLASNLVRETGVGSSQGGRRPILIEFNYQSSFVLGIELADTRLTVLLTDLAATVIRRAQCPLDIAAGPDSGLLQVVALVEDVLSVAGIARHTIIGAGVGVPAPLAFATGRPIAPPVMPGWHDVPLRTLIENALGIPTFVENDANLGALAEHRWGSARGWQNVAYLYLGSAGVGCGLILEGRLYRGDTGSAGEIGHVLVDEDGPACGCGASGCLEALIGAPALLSRARATGLDCERIEDLVALGHAGDPRAAAVLNAAGNYLGIAVASILNMINPGCVVVGGVLAAAGHLLLEPLRATLRQRSLPVAVEHVEIRTGALGPDVVAIGAVSIVVQHAFSIPALAQATNGRNTERGWLEARL